MESVLWPIFFAVLAVVVLILAVHPWVDLKVELRVVMGLLSVLVFFPGAIHNFVVPDGEPVLYSELPPGAYVKLTEHGEFVLVKKEGAKEPLHVRSKAQLPEHFSWVDGKIHPILPPKPDPGSEAQEPNQ